MEYFISKVKSEILAAVKGALDQEVDLKQLEITVPPEPTMGDFAVPCFYLAKLLRISPNQIAIDLKAKIHPHGVIKSVQNVGPYLNFYLNNKYFSRHALKEINRLRGKYGSFKLAKDQQKKIMIEYSQPNTHKEFHVGHLRNVVLGASLVNLHRFVGEKVIAANYIGDIGAHVAKCLWALEKFHQNETLPENKGRYLGQIYTEASKKIAENPAYKQEADEILQKLERGDKKFIALWKKTRAWSLEDFNQIYKILNVKFDKFFYESEVEKPGKKIVQELLDKGLAEKSEGAVIINLEKYNLKNFLLLKSDGSSLYSTKELALAQLKFNKFKIDESYVVVDMRQSFYFQQFFKTLELMGFNKKTAHISYNFVTLKEGPMASREGNVVLFEDFFQQIAARAAAETKKRHADWEEKKIQETAEKIALAAIKFSMLKTGNNNLIVFDPEESLSFDGFTGPYLQYTVTRINSILVKESFGNLKEVNFGKLDLPLEKQLVIKLAGFPQLVQNSCLENQPSILSQYLFDLAKLFAYYYQTIPILAAADEIKKARLLMIDSLRQVLVNGLTLLGIETVEKM